MIEIAKAYKTSDDKTFSTIEEAQQHELRIVTSGDGDVIESIIANADAVIAILKLKARKKRTAKVKVKAKPAKALTLTEAVNA